MAYFETVGLLAPASWPNSRLDNYILPAYIPACSSNREEKKKKEKSYHFSSKKSCCVMTDASPSQKWLCFRKRCLHVPPRLAHCCEEVCPAPWWEQSTELTRREPALPCTPPSVLCVPLCMEPHYTGPHPHSLQQVFVLPAARGGLGKAQRAGRPRWEREDSLDPCL